LPIYTSAAIPDTTEEVNQCVKQVELRLRRLGASNLGDATSTTGASLQAVTAPQVTGLELVQNLNTITVRWFPVPVANIDFYEIEIDRYPSFPSPEVTRQRTLQYTYQSGSPGDEYYVRVRVKVTGGGYGSWSGRLNTSTGLVATANMGSGSATTLTDHERDLSALPALDPRAAASAVPLTQTYPGTTVKTEGGTMLPFVTFKYKMASRWNNSGTNYIKVSLMRAGSTQAGAAKKVTADVVSVDCYQPTYGDYAIGAAANSTLGDVPLLGLGTPDEPGSGVFEYWVELEVMSNPGSNSYLRVQPVSVNLEIVELRN
jgi:hypothetical protein